MTTTKGQENQLDDVLCGHAGLRASSCFPIRTIFNTVLRLSPRSPQASVCSLGKHVFSRLTFALLDCLPPFHSHAFESHFFNWKPLTKPAAVFTQAGSVSFCWRCLTLTAMTTVVVSNFISITVFSVFHELIARQGPFFLLGSKHDVFADTRIQHNKRKVYF